MCLRTDVTPNIFHGFELEETLHSSASCQVYRTRRSTDGLAAVLKLFADAGPGSRQACRREYSVLERLIGAAVPKPVTLLEDGSSCGFAAEDIGGVSLDKLGLAGTLSLGETLALAERIAGALGTLHERGLIHRRLALSSIIWNRASNAVSLIDVSGAAFTSETWPEMDQPCLSPRMLRYASPEVCRAVRHEVSILSDMYSLGVCLYELLAGHPPFVSEDPLELAHLHLAQPPEPIPTVPGPVNGLLQRLLAKSPLERPSSTELLVREIRHCLHQVERNTAPADWTHYEDVPTRALHSPDQVLAREGQVARFRQLLLPLPEAGACLLRLIGEPGTGKTALAQQCLRPVVAENGYFGSANLEPYQGRTSWCPLVQALRGVLRTILTEPEPRIEQWRNAVCPVVGGGSAALLDAIPELTFLVDATHQLSPSPKQCDAERFALALEDLVLALASQGKPVCFFFDDLQWADPEFLHLLKELLHVARSAPLMLITAERCDVDQLEPMVDGWLQELAEQGSRIETLTLENFGLEETTEYLTRILAAGVNDLPKLAEEIRRQTNGNPFAIRTFLQGLHTSGLLRPVEDGWRCDIERVRHEPVTENVVALLKRQLSDLPEQCRKTLSVAACIGKSFTLRRLLSLKASASIAELAPAFSQRFLFASTHLRSLTDPSGAADSTELWFAHDRVRQAVLETLTPEALGELHLRIGTTQLESGACHSSSDELFATVRHLNAATTLRGAPADPERLASLNLKASTAALVAGSTRAALEYAEAGLGLLAAEDAWATHYELNRDLHIAGVRAAHANSERRRAVELGTALQNARRSPTDSAAVSALLGTLVLGREGGGDEALKTWLGALSDLGVSVPAEPTEEQADLVMHDVEQRLDAQDLALLWCAPACREERTKYALEILDTAIFNVFYRGASPHLFRVLVATMIQLSLDRGLNESCALGYVFYGCLLARAGRKEDAAKYGQLATSIARRFQNNAVLARALTYANFQLAHWTAPAAEMSKRYRDAYQVALEVPSPFDAANLAAGHCINRFLAGDALGPLMEDMGTYTKVIDRFRQHTIHDWLAIYRQAAHNLTSQEAEPWRLEGEFFDENETPRSVAVRTNLGSVFNLNHAKAWLALMFHEPVQILAGLDAAEPFYVNATENSGWGGSWAFVSSLLRYAALPELDVTGNANAFEAIRRHRVRLEEGARFNPKECRHRLILLDAEDARHRGDEAASERYRQAVELARQAALIHEHAITCELAGRHALEQQNHELARTYLREALECYVRWGAHNKVRHLEHRYGVLMPRVTAGRLSTEALSKLYEEDVRFGLLDLAGVLASLMVISQELDTRRLLARLLELLVETAGAERGLVAVEKDDQWFIVARIDRGNTEVLDTPLASVEAAVLAPLCLLRYVIRTREPVLLDNATAHREFGTDTYLTTNAVKSTLCFPLTQQGRQRGAIYLENNLVTGAFTTNRLTILSMLSAQAAISLENAELYETLERRVRSRTEELSKKNLELEEAMLRLKNAQARMIMQDRMASLGSMTAGIAHEIRNPLNFIANFAKISQNQIRSLIEAGGNGSAIDKRSRTLSLLGTNLERIVEHSGRINGIISSVLEHSRGGGREPRLTDINALVTTYVNLAKTGTQADNARSRMQLDVRLEERVPSLNLVPDEIGRVLLNLIDNACYSVAKRLESGRPLDGPPRVVVSTHLTEDAVEIRVWDNGMGVPLEIRDKIFTPFYSSKPSGIGTGLGLSISHDIVVQGLGGSMRLESEDGTYAEFTLVLPFARLSVQ